MSDQSIVTSHCPFCGSRVSRTKRWLRIVRAMARFAILYATLSNDGK